eukprot:3904582-Alexandrium_andersonii.AAC.1
MSCLSHLQARVRSAPSSRRSRRLQATEMAKAWEGNEGPVSVRALAGAFVVSRPSPRMAGGLGRALRH